MIVSDGSRSLSERAALPWGRHLQLGSGVPGSHGELLIRKIETQDGSSPSEAASEKVRALWVVRRGAAVVPVSIVEGGRTRTVKNRWAPGAELEVGDRIRVEQSVVEVVALRALGKTFRRPGRKFRAEEVGRVYTRRIEIPPAGRSDWRRGRPIRSSRTRSSSRSARSRSGPGVRR